MPNQTLIYFANPFEWKLFEEHLQNTIYLKHAVKNLTQTFCRINSYDTYTINTLRKLLPQSVIKSKYRHNNRSVYTTH